MQAKVGVSQLMSQRRYPRVYHIGMMQDLAFLKNAEVIWSDRLSAGIYDFGRTGFVVYFPMRLNKNFSRSEIIRLGLCFGADSEPIFIETTVLRCESRLLVAKLPKIAIHQQQLIENFFSDEYISENMHFVPQRAYAPEQTFTHWFHGPRDTNLYVWLYDKKLRRVTLEIGASILEWNEHGFFIGQSRDMLSYATEDYAYYTNTLAELRPLTAQSDEALRLRYLISCLISTHPVIKEVSCQIVD